MSIFKDWICEHPNYSAVRAQLCLAIDRMVKEDKPFLFTLLGSTGVGKTQLLRSVMNQYNKQGTRSTGLIHFVSMPASPTGEALAKKIIESFVGHIRISGSSADLRTRAARMIAQSGAKVLIIDELNHLVEMRRGEAAQTKENRRTADWLKEILDEHGISLILSGLPHTRRFLSDNEQFERRAMRPLEIMPYAWDGASDQAAFENVVLDFITRMKDNKLLVNIDLNTLTRACHLACKGSVGAVHKLMSALETINPQSKRRTLDDFAEVYEVHFHGAICSNPFRMDSISDIELDAQHRATINGSLLLSQSRGLLGKSRSNKDF